MSGPDPVCLLRGTGSAITYLKFQGLSTENLYSGCENGKMCIWNMSTRRLHSSFTAHADHSVLWIDFMNDKLVTQGREGLVKVWSAKDSEWILTGHAKSGHLVFCPSTFINNGNSKVLAVPSNTMSQVDIYDCKTFNCIGHLQPCTSKSKFGMCLTIKSLQNGTDILIGYENGSVALWDIRYFRMVDSISCHQESLMCLDYSSCLNKGISGSVDNRIVSWKLTSEKCLEKSETIEVTNAGFNDIAIRQDSRICATAGWDSNVRVFGMKKLKPLAVLSYHKLSIQCVTFSDDNILACGSKDQYISLWDVYK